MPLPLLPISVVAPPPSFLRSSYLPVILAFIHIPYQPSIRSTPALQIKPPTAQTQTTMSNPIFKSAIQKALEASRKVASSTLAPQQISSKPHSSPNAETHSDSTTKRRPRPTIHGFAIDSAPFYAPSRKNQLKDARSGENNSGGDVVDSSAMGTVEMDSQVQDFEDERAGMGKEYATKEEEKGGSGAGGH